MSLLLWIATARAQDADLDGFDVAVDCEDTDPTRYPGAPESTCDSVDSDCGGEADVLVPSSQPTIQAGIDAAVAGDTVCVAPGEYRERLVITGKSLNLVGTAGSLATAVAPPRSGSVLTIVDAGVVRVEGLLLTRGRSAAGGGIAAAAGLAPLVLELSDVVLWANTSTGDGGGLHGTGVALISDDLVIDSNDATGNGGGLALVSCACAGGDFASSWTDLGAMVRENTAVGIGGGAWLESAGADLEGTILRGNSADDGGGGLSASRSLVALPGSPVLALTSVWIDRNDALGAGAGMRAEYDAVLRSVRLTKNVINGSERGGGLAFHRGHLDMEDSTISGNKANMNGSAGVDITGPATFDIRRSAIVDNSGEGSAAGIRVSTGGSISDTKIARNSSTESEAGGLQVDTRELVTLTNLDVSDNSGTEGGGAWLAGPVQVIGGVFSGNSSNNNGGGIYAPDADQQTYDGVLVKDNTTGKSGGGMYLSNGAPTLRNVVIVGNDAEEGGGLWIADGTVENALIAANTAITGAGLRALPGPLHQVDVAQSTIVGNTATGAGGGVKDAASITGSIVAFNTAVAEGGVSAAGSVTYTDAFANTPDDYSLMVDPTGTAGNVSVDPLFAYFDPTAPPTTWDLRLDPASPLVDAGDPLVLDPDGTTADLGAFGGPGAAGW